MILAVGLALGCLLGAILGVTIYWMHPGGHSDLGVMNPATTQSSMATDAEVYATYAGSASCQTCHAKEYDAWATSHHGLAERNIDPKIDTPAFDPPRHFKHGTQATDVRLTAGKFEIVTPGLNGQTVFQADRVIGVDPLRQFLTPTTGGRWQTFEASYDPHKNEWFNVYGNEDRKPGEWGHWTGRGMNWNSMCAACHNTRVRKNYDEATDAYHTAMAQPTVSCESCHGPLKAHVEWQNRAHGSVKETATSPRRFSKDQMLATCGSCHARRGELTGDFAPGDAFGDHYSLTIPDLSDLFYPDGQVKEEDYELTAFTGSKMHAAGVRCVDCHEPHSSKTLLPGNALCMRCHNGSFQGSPLIVPEQHSFHKADSAGNQCVNCHMPQTTYMQRHGRHDHGFTIPDPLLTRDYKVPNACNRCHTDKDADWSLAATEKWYGDKMRRPTRDRATWVAKAREGKPEAKASILSMLIGEKQGFWRAVMTGLLSQWLGGADVKAALIAAKSDTDPLVRENAARSLEPLAHAGDQDARNALRALVTDPVRAVRIRALWGLRDAVNPDSPGGHEFLAYLKLGADQPGGAMQQGFYAIAKQDVDTAVKYFQKAVSWDANSAPIHDALAVGLGMQGKYAESIDHLRRAVRLEPRVAEYWYKLALAYGEVKEPDRTIQCLQQVLKIEPHYPRAGYNLGLAYAATNHLSEAVAALRDAEIAEPSNAEIPYARATIHLRLNQPAEAEQAARRALQIDPNYAEAGALLRSLGK